MLTKMIHKYTILYYVITVLVKYLVTCSLMAGQKSKQVETTACDLHAATLLVKTLVSWPRASRKLGSVDMPSVRLSATCKSKLHLLGSALIRFLADLSSTLRPCCSFCRRRTSQKRCRPSSLATKSSS